MHIFSLLSSNTPTSKYKPSAGCANRASASADTLVNLAQGSTVWPRFNCSFFGSVCGGFAFQIPLVGAMVSRWLIWVLSVPGSHAVALFTVYVYILAWLFLISSSGRCSGNRQHLSYLLAVLAAHMNFTYPSCAEFNSISPAMSLSLLGYVCFHRRSYTDRVLHIKLQCYSNVQS